MIGSVVFRALPFPFVFPCVTIYKGCESRLLIIVVILLKLVYCLPLVVQQGMHLEPLEFKCSSARQLRFLLLRT